MKTKNKSIQQLKIELEAAKAEYWKRFNALKPQLPRRWRLAFLETHIEYDTNYGSQLLNNWHQGTVINETILIFCEEIFLKAENQAA